MFNENYFNELSNDFLCYYPAWPVLLSFSFSARKTSHNKSFSFVFYKLKLQPARPHVEIYSFHSIPSFNVHCSFETIMQCENVKRRRKTRDINIKRNTVTWLAIAWGWRQLWVLLLRSDVRVILKGLRNYLWLLDKRNLEGLGNKSLVAADNLSNTFW